jgi:hypothetical protein
LYYRSDWNIYHAVNIVHAANRRITIAAFWPPKPKLVDTATFTGISRAVFGT